MKLMIVESPNKVKKISAYLGAGWKVAASVGHIRDLPEKDMGLEPPSFKPTYVVSRDKKKVVAGLRALCAKADEVFLATDPDREGEAIAWHLAQELRLKKPRRVTFSEITHEAIQKALKNPREIDYKLVSAQEARRCTDRVCGWVISPILSRQAMVPLSAGRVQSPTLKLIVMRERDIMDFVPRAFFQPEANVADGITLSLVSKGWCEDGKHIFDREIADTIAAHTDLVITANHRAEKTARPPAPFTTSTLVQAASKVLKLGTQETMQLAQKLFEEGLITYHRTDSPNLSEDGHAKIAAFAQATGLPVASARMAFSSADGAQEGHEAIRPAQIERETSGLGDKAQVLYQLIRERALASVLEPAVDVVSTLAAETDAPLNAGGLNRTAVYQATARMEASAGWRTVLTLEKPPRPDTRLDCALEPGTQVSVTIEVAEKRTESPKRFTEGELVKALEKLGIGRPSTYGSIIENIKKRGYIEEKRSGKGRGQLVPTETGFKLVDALADMTFMNLDFTRKLEGHLDQIARGKARFEELMAAFYGNIETEKGRVKFPVPLIPVTACPDCGAALKRLYSKKTESYFWVHIEDTTGCSQYLRDNDGMPSQNEKTAH